MTSLLTAESRSGKKRRVRVELEVEVPQYELDQTPSRKDGLTKATEDDLRVWCCQFIQDTGILLRMPQVVMACAQILFQRFYYRKSMVAIDVKASAMACLFLAAKVEEAPQSLCNIVHTGHHVQQKLSRTQAFGGAGSAVGHLDRDKYLRMKNEVIKAERRVLKELGFCVHLKHPHKLIISYQKMIGLESNRELSQLAWNYMNDGLRTSAFIRYPAPVIACACLHLGTLKLGIAMPEWSTAFDVSTEELESAAAIIIELYHRPRRFLGDMEAEILETRKKKEAARHAEIVAARKASNSPGRNSAVSAAMIERMQGRRTASPLVRAGKADTHEASDASKASLPPPAQVKPMVAATSAREPSPPPRRRRDDRDDREDRHSRPRSRSPPRRNARDDRGRDSDRGRNDRDGAGYDNRRRDRDRDRDRDRNRDRRR
eukprot:m.151779 g.151779  ORF g.151779 m.151779 type:complete len:431 (+) comp23364_c0_seq1:1736-3028(+)